MLVAGGAGPRDPAATNTPGRRSVHKTKPPMLDGRAPNVELAPRRPRSAYARRSPFNRPPARGRGRSAGSAHGSACTGGSCDEPTGGEVIVGGLALATGCMAVGTSVRVGGTTAALNIGDAK